MSQVSVARPRGDQTRTVYMGVWFCLSLVSLAYIAIALLKPDLLVDTRLPGLVGGRGPDPGQSQGALLERGLADVRGQLTDIQLKVMRGELREQELATRLAAIESRIEEIATARPSSATAPLPPADPRVDKAAEKAAEKAERTRTSALQPQQPARPTAAAPATTQATRPTEGEVADAEPAARPTAKGQKGTPLETASIGKGVQPFGAPEVRVERTEKAEAPATPRTADEGAPVGIQLGGAPSLDSLRLNWTILSDRHGESLGGLQPRYVTSDALGTTSFNLVAGPVPNRAEAIRICAKLRNQGVSCRLTAFQGSQL